MDVVHGHSSHHPRPLEIYRDRLILRGCGDLINDYEGIAGHESYRGDLRPMFFATVGANRLVGLRVVMLQSHQMRLRHASRTDVAWSCATLDLISRPFGIRVVQDADGGIDVCPV